MLFRYDCLTMTYEFTERMVTIFSRWMERTIAKNLQLIENIKKTEDEIAAHDAEDGWTLNYQNWKIKNYVCFHTNDEHDSDDYGDIIWDNLWCQTDIRYNDKLVCCLGNPTIQTDYMEKLRLMVGSYKDCECLYRVVKVDTYCDDCYPFILPHPTDEVCSICLDDRHGVWVKTECNHIFHQLCWRKLDTIQNKKKCPLCRKVSMCHSVKQI